MGALTLDSGALIALENRKAGMSKILEVARLDGRPILAPANAVAEWWRGGREQRDILSALTIVDVTEQIAKLAGEALAWLYGRNREARVNSLVTVDATVIATAALYGPDLYTGDSDDMRRLGVFFPSVRRFGLR